MFKEIFFSALIMFLLFQLACSDDKPEYDAEYCQGKGIVCKKDYPWYCEIWEACGQPEDPNNELNRCHYCYKE